jgi:hypothetical protein
MAQRGKKIQDDHLVMALACGATVEAAAQAAGLSKRTVYRRLDDPDFRQRRQALRADLVQRTAAMLTAAGGESVRTLLALQKERIPPATRLGAARAALEIGLKLREQAELEQRIAALDVPACAGKRELIKTPEDALQLSGFAGRYDRAGKRPPRNLSPHKFTGR